MKLRISPSSEESSRLCAEKLPMRMVMHEATAAYGNKITHSGCHMRKKRMKPESIFLILSTVCVTLHMVATLAHAFSSDHCQPTQSFFCNIQNYQTVTPFRNTLGHSSLEEARSSLHRYGFLMTHPQCSRRVQLFLCSLYFPVCVNSAEVAPGLLMPCKRTCEEAYKCEFLFRSLTNQSWPDEWECNKFALDAEDPLCVQNLNNETSPDPTPLQTNAVGPNPSGPSEDPAPNDEMISNHSQGHCDPGFFDCRFTDPLRPLCIESKYRCDGRSDCVRNDSSPDPHEGFDEVNCSASCAEGQLHCDDKCIDRHDICNGRVDCSSGIDEQDCIDNLTTVIQSILCIFVMCSAVAILVKFFHVDSDQEDKEQTYEPTTTTRCAADGHIDQKPYEVPPPPSFYPPPVPTHDLHRNDLIHDYRDILYTDTSVLTTTRSLYERIQGGHSGASSVYGFEPLAEPSRHKEAPPTPPPPPPTPSPSTLYENLEDYNLRD